MCRLSEEAWSDGEGWGWGRPSQKSPPISSDKPPPSLPSPHASASPAADGWGHDEDWEENEGWEEKAPGVGCERGPSAASEAALPHPTPSAPPPLSPPVVGVVRPSVSYGSDYAWDPAPTKPRAALVVAQADVEVGGGVRRIGAEEWRGVGRVEGRGVGGSGAEWAAVERSGREFRGLRGVGLRGVGLWRGAGEWRGFGRGGRVRG